MLFFLKTMKLHKQGDREALDRAIKALDLSRVDPAIRRNFGRRAAEQLIHTLDRLERIDIEAIPDLEIMRQSGENKWYFRRQNILYEEQRHYVEIAIEKVSSAEDDEQLIWLFGPATLQTIQTYYRFIRDRPVVEGVLELTTWRGRMERMLPSWMTKKYFVLYNIQWIGLFLILFLALAFDKMIKFYFDFITKKLIRGQRLRFNQDLQDKLNIPIHLITFALVWNIGIHFLDFSESTLSILMRLGRIVMTLGVVIGLYHIVDVVAHYFQEIAKTTKNKFDDILVPLVRKAAKTVVVAIGIVAIGDSLTLDVKSILAGLGIGGIAFALAARDTISNMFGSLTVLLDRPFEIGDWVNIGGNVEGIVEEVGLRSTRIRTFYDSLITVPNGQLTNIHIDNYGRRTYRRYFSKFGLQYDTPPEKVEAFCEAVRQIILGHPHTRKDMFHIYFNELNSHSLDILIFVFFRVPDWATELAERHRFLIDVIRVAKELDVRFAFPTQTLHLFEEQAKAYSKGPMAPEENHDFAKISAEKIIKNPYSLLGHRSNQEAILKNT